ncbi:MAG: helix-turn-helix transcriptional regulator [Caulobacteraceae bacterium]
MDEGEYERFLDLLGEATVDPALWTPVVERLADLAGGDCGFVSRLSLTDGSGAVQTARIDPVIVQRYHAYFAAKNPLTIVGDRETYVRNWRLNINSDDHLMAKDDLVRSEYYNDFMTPADCHSCLMVRLALDGDHVSAITLNRPRRRDRFSEADFAVARLLHPHLVRAFGVGRRLAEARAPGEDLTAFLERSANGVLILDGEGKVLHRNGAAERLIAADGRLKIARGRLAAADHGADCRLRGLVAQAASTEAGRCRGGSIGLTSPAHRFALSVTVSPMRPRGDSLFADGPAVLVTVADVGAAFSAPEATLRALFCLSPAEARVAMALAAGRTPKEAAADLGLSFFTVRGHLVRIFEKTQTNRQADLIRVLTRVEAMGLALGG